MSTLTVTSFSASYGLAVAPSGSVYIADMVGQRVRVVSPSGTISTFAGSGTSGFSGDGGPAVKAQLSYPAGVAVSADNRLFIADMFNNRIRRVDPDGTISTSAGTGTMGFSGDGGPATAAQLAWPTGLAFDSAGNLYLSESNEMGVGTDGPAERIRRVDTSGTITTTAGTAIAGICGDGGPATQAQLGNPTQLAFNNAGNLIVADAGLAQIREITLADAATAAGAPAAAVTPSTVTSGNMRTVAGTGVAEYCGDGVAAGKASLANPQALAVDSAGAVYVSDQGNSRIRKIGTDGVITTVVGDGTPGSGGDGGPATKAQVQTPMGIAVDKTGNLYFTDADAARVRKVDANGVITTIAGTGIQGFTGDGGPASKAMIETPWGITVNDAGEVYFASMGAHNAAAFPMDGNNARIRKIDTTGTISTVAGIGKPGFSGDGGPATKAQFARPTGLALNDAGNLLIVDSGNHRIRMIDSSGTISTVAGSDIRGYQGEGGPATKAAFDIPWSVTADSSGNMFVSDIGSVANVRRIDAKGIISTAAGVAPGGYNGEDDPNLRR